jgi:cell wall assembly regulator SMI1
MAQKLNIMFFSETERTLTSDEIKAFEAKFNITLPPDFFAHILKYNGGRCMPNTFCFVENDQITESTVHYFFAIYDGEDDNLHEQTEYLHQITDLIQLIPIASDPGNNLIVLCCAPTSELYGRVLFYDHDLDYTSTNQLPRIAENFDTFLASLY